MILRLTTVVLVICVAFSAVQTVLPALARSPNVERAAPIPPLGSLPPSGPKVTEPAPEITSVSPNNGNVGETLDVIVTGNNFSGATEVGFGQGVTVNQFNIDSDTQITANITITSVEATDRWIISVTRLDSSSEFDTNPVHPSTSEGLLFALFELIIGAVLAYFALTRMRRGSNSGLMESPKQEMPPPTDMGDTGAPTFT